MKGDEKLWFNLEVENISDTEMAFVEHSHRFGDRDYTNLTEYMVSKLDEIVDWQLNG